MWKLGVLYQSAHIFSTMGWILDLNIETKGKNRSPRVFQKPVPPNRPHKPASKSPLCFHIYLHPFHSTDREVEEDGTLIAKKVPDRDQLQYQRKRHVHKIPNYTSHAKKKTLCFEKNTPPLQGYSPLDLTKTKIRSGCTPDPKINTFPPPHPPSPLNIIPPTYSYAFFFPLHHYLFPLLGTFLLFISFYF